MGTEAHNMRSTSKGVTYVPQFPSNENPVTDFSSTYPFLQPLDSLKLDAQEPFLDSISLMDFPDVPFSLDQNSYLPTSGPSSTTSGLSSSSPTSDPSSGSNLSMNTIYEGEHHDDTEVFSDLVLTYINNMLMEENMDEKPDMYQEPSVVQATEKLLSDLIGQNYSPSVTEQSQDSYIQIHDSSDSSSNGGVDWSKLDTLLDHQANQTRDLSGGLSSVSSLNTFTSTNQGVGDFFTSKSAVPDLSLASIPAWQFMKGVEEARKFLPSQDKLNIDLEANGVILPLNTNKKKEFGEIKAEQVEKENSINVSKGRKHTHRDDYILEEGRNVKQSATYTEEEAVRTEMFDKVLLCHEENCGENGKVIKDVLRVREAVESAVNSTGRGRGKRQAKKEVVDLRTLLIQCAQMVAADDRRGATELLKQIRQHSSPCGDGNQRLAHYFADGLEARLAGTGSQIYHSLVSKRRPASFILRAYQLYLAACPFKRIMYFVSNRTILDLAETAMRVHIIDFGIYYGFQWPCLIQLLGRRPGGPPKLRITGIDVPLPGFRPAERIEQTGERLADYAKSFKVPFEYQAIASKYDDIRVEDLRIEKDELLIVNCLYKSKIVMDETVFADSPRDMFLKNIKQMKPDLFILGIVNGTFNAPFFVTRFREALFHYSALFDMLDTNVPREEEQRGLIESELFGREILNVISCEGADRVERPETYKQWQARTVRAGFEQVPLNREIVKRANVKVRGSYHKDFIMDEDSRWLVQGWKGRITQAISTWKPAKFH